jgi:hypothetical protein
MRPHVLFTVLLLLSAGAARGDPPPLCPSPLRIIVVQTPAGVPTASLHRVFHDSAGAHDDAATQRQSITDAVTASLVRTLDGAGLTPAGTVRLDTSTAADDIGRGLDADTLAALQTAQPADAFLRVTVSDYGETPVRWKAAYVTFEVVTTLAIAGALLVHRVTRPLAGIYLVQEGAEEFGEGYAGFWLLNRLSRPVRISADLVDATSGKDVWQGKATGLSRWRWRELRHQDATSREALLQSSTRKAVGKLVHSLQKVLAQRCASAAAP